GYRLYGEADFARLQQIVTLKFVGLSLKQIREVLGHQRKAARPPLAGQRRLLEAKRDQINAAITALVRVEAKIGAGGAGPSQSELCEILEMIAMHNHTEWEQLHARYFTEEQRADMARRADPELAAEGTRKWTELIDEVEAAAKAGEAPKGQRARSLVARWDGLCQEFMSWATGPGSKIKPGEVQGALANIYSDRHNWPGGLKAPCSDAAWQFIHAAREQTTREQAAREGAARNPPATDAIGEPVSLGKYGEFEIYPMPMFATVATNDVAALRDWYVGALGFAVVFQTPSAQGQGAMAHLRRKKYQDLLLVHNSERASSSSSAHLTISFQTDDVDALAERARRMPSPGKAQPHGGASG
ncbi:MAG: MerR family DNA-binding protein, partial [Terriglobales bacterium]